jgi:hypothetical protein
MGGYAEIRRSSATGRRALISTYRDVRDTVLAGRGYWLVTWRSTTRASRPSGGAMVADPTVEEHGYVLVDKQGLVPAYASWQSVLGAPPAPQAIGTTATSLRGRAWLAGSPFDSLR